MHSTGIDLPAVIAAFCRHLGTEAEELARPTRRREIAHARALVSYIAVWNLSISGSEAARRLNVDRSAFSRAVRKVSRDPDLAAVAETILGQVERATRQQ